VNHRQGALRRQVLLRTGQGRGRKRSPWVMWLYTELADNFLSYARKAMIRCDLSLNINGQLEVEQLSPELPAICKTHDNHFKGEPVPSLGKLTDVVEDVIDDGGDENAGGYRGEDEESLSIASEDVVL
jgi:hypothetical protein